MDADLVLVGIAPQTPQFLRQIFEAAHFTVVDSPRMLSVLHTENEVFLKLQKYISVDGVEESQVEIDVWIQGHGEFFDRVKAAGTRAYIARREVVLTPYNLQVTLHKYHHQIAMKKLKDGRVLSCLNASHSACLPNCTALANQVHCEFDDNFVELDTWT